MKKRSSKDSATEKQFSKELATRFPELERLDKRNIDFMKFKPDLSAEDIRKLLGKPGNVVFPPIETLSPVKTVGRSFHTNVQIAASEIVQPESVPPFVRFDQRARAPQSWRPVLFTAFEPSAYGITPPATYIMEFTIEVLEEQATFTLGGWVTSGAILNAGTKVLIGSTRVSLVFENVAGYTFGSLRQDAGGHGIGFPLRSVFRI